MSIEVTAPELYALAATLRGCADGADEAASRLVDQGDVGAPLRAAVEGFLECHRAGAGALAGELRWLAATVAGIADSWLQLDGSLLAPRGQATRR